MFMTTYKEVQEKIGTKGHIQLGRLKIEVEILDYKKSYNHDRWLVSPLAGAGQVWVEKVNV